MSVHPSCYRSQAKRDRTPTPEQFKQWWMKAYTSDEVIEKIRALPDDKYLDGWFKFMPKEIKVDQSSTFRLVIEGLQHKVVKEIDAGQSVMALEEGNNNNNNVIDVYNDE
jgi:hypothetical protein